MIKMKTDRRLTIEWWPEGKAARNKVTVVKAVGVAARIEDAVALVSLPLNAVGASKAAKILDRVSQVALRLDTMLYESAQFELLTLSPYEAKPGEALFEQEPSLILNTPDGEAPLYFVQATTGIRDRRWGVCHGPE